MAFVASGTNAGVRTSPCAVSSTPARAAEGASRAVIRKGATAHLKAATRFGAALGRGGSCSRRSLLSHARPSSRHQVVENVGYPVLFLARDGRVGWRPRAGETALITGALLASQRKLSIEVVIAIAAVAAIVGDNIGYLIGRKGAAGCSNGPARFDPSAAGRSKSANRSSSATDRRRSSSGAGSWGCASGPPGSPGPPRCPGGRSSSGTPSEGSPGRRRSVCSPTSWKQRQERFADFGVFGLVTILLALRAACCTAAPPPPPPHRGDRRAREENRGPGRRPRLSRLEAWPSRTRGRPQPKGAIRSHSSASEPSSSSVKRERKCSRTTARWVTRASPKPFPSAR